MPLLHTSSLTWAPLCTGTRHNPLRSPPLVRRDIIAEAAAVITAHERASASVLSFYARYVGAHVVAAVSVGMLQPAAPTLAWPTVTYFPCDVPWFAGNQVASLPMQTVEDLITTYSPVSCGTLLKYSYNM
jgi:hypothetical protein